MSFRLLLLDIIFFFEPNEKIIRCIETKTDNEGDMMGKVDCVREAIDNDRIEIARSLLEIGKLSMEEISMSTNLPLEKIRQLDETI